MRSIILFLVLAIAANISAEKKLLCYYGSWATYRNGNGASHVSDLDPFICTHLIYGFVAINEDATIRIMDPWLELADDWGRDNFAKFNALKNINPNLKTIVAIGGWNEGSLKYSVVANDPALRTKFAQNAAAFTIEHGFDGFDLDWEYPAQRDSAFPDTDKASHALLLQEMRAEFDKYGLILSAAVASVKASAGLSYDIPALGKYLDIISVMAYDLHGPWDKMTGHNADLFRYQDDVAPEDSYDVETAINYWISQGAPKEKIILGLPLYGRTFSLTNPSDTSVGAAANGAGIAGQYTYENGMIGLNELCEKQLTGAWPEHWDSVAEVPYTFNGNNWISYDNHVSLAKKVELAMAKDLGGVFVWSIETDDFKGVCHSEKFAYLRTINKGIGRTVGVWDSGATTTTTSTSTTTTAAPEASDSTTASTTTTTSSATTGVCTASGYVRDSSNCSVFYNCVTLSAGGYKSYKYTCPTGLYFDPALTACNYPSAVAC